jgi:hypothetical protein
MGPAVVRVTCIFLKMLRASNMQREVPEQGACVKQSQAVHERVPDSARLPTPDLN